MRYVVFLLGAALTVCLSLGVRPVRADGEEGFVDVPKNHWAYQAVTELKRKGILIGYPSPKSTKRSPQARSLQFDPNAAETNRIRREDDIREAVVRYILQSRHWEAGRDRVFFVGIEPGHKDPNAALLKRLAAGGLPVKPISSAVETERGGVRDRITGKRGIKFWIGPIQWTTRTQAEVRASDWYGPKAAMTGVFRVSWEGSHWVVKGVKGPMRVSMTMPAR